MKLTFVLKTDSNSTACLCFNQDHLHTPIEIKINIMTFLLSPCLLWISTCISFLSADSIISARLNSTVLLPCNFTLDLSQTLFEWRIGRDTVFERQGEKIYQGKGYEGRVDVPEDELRKGNCSLELKNVRNTDANIYKSYMMVKRIKRTVSEKWHFVQNIELRIDETPLSPGNQVSDKATSPPKTNDAGMNSPNRLISYSIPAVVAVLMLATITILYRRRIIKKPSKEVSQNSRTDDEHQVFVDT